MFIVEPCYSHQFKCFTKTNAHCRHNGGPEHISLLALCLEELQEASREKAGLRWGAGGYLWYKSIELNNLLRVYNCKIDMQGGEGNA